MTDVQSGVSKSDYSFGQIAIRENLCTFEQVKECLDIQGKLRGLGIEPKKLGEILIEKGYVTPEQAVAIAKLQVQSATSQKVTIPGYEILSKVGAGAMGTVYKGRQVSMDRLVAIKILSARYAKDSLFVDRFVREARAVAKLNHENIIGGIDVGESGGHHYFVMEFVDGVGVQSILKREGRIDEKRCLQIGLQMAKALAHAHRHGIVHRDVKPENIMITTAGVAKLCDLGLAKQTKGDTDVTMDGTSVGTPNYISPEQARGEDKIDIRTDIYSLGASLYHMSTGTTPFTGANPMVVMTKHVTEYPDPPKKRLASLSEGFSNLVMHMMQKRREDRHQDPDALMADIESLLRGGELAPAPSSAPPRPASVVVRPATERHSRHPTTVRPDGLMTSKVGASKVPLYAGVGVVAVAVAGFVLLRGGGDAQTVSPGPPKRDVSAVKPPTNPSGVPDSADRVRKEIQDFKGWAEKQMASTSPDRFTAPYAQIQKKLDQYKNDSNFPALDQWHDEQSNYVEKANKFITERVWEPVRLKVDQALGSGQLAQAVEELGKFEEVYKYLGEGKQEKTRAAIQFEDRMANIESSAKEVWLEGKQAADLKFSDLSQRDQAYTALDVLAAQLLPRQKGDLEAARLKYFERDLGDLLGAVPTPEKIRLALDRVAKLRTRHPGNESAVGWLDASAKKLKEASEDYSKGALLQANALYTTGFKPRFDEAMQQRDLLGGRRQLGLIYTAKEAAALQTYLLPAPGMDAALLKSFVDPTRVTPVDTRKLVQLAEEGWKFSQRPGSAEAARDLYFDLRAAALVEEIVEQALEGARFAGADPGKFKTGYSAQLKDAQSIVPNPRKPGEGASVTVTVPGKGFLILAVTPRKDPSLSEDDVIALAKRAPSASNDPQFALKAFFLCQYGGKLPSAKAWYEKLTPDQRAGLGRFEEGLKGTVSSAAEADAQRLYEEGFALWKKKDEGGAIRKFKECLEKYGNTAYMKSPVKLLSGEKSRSQILEESFKLTGSPGGASSPKSPVKVNLKDVFSGADVRELGRGKMELTYAFKDDRELGAFQTVPSAFGAQLIVARVPAGGVRLGGTGFWTSVARFKGDVLCEISFKAEVQKALGFVVHAQGDKAGYATVIKLDIPGAGQLDAIFKMPLQLGPQLLNSILAQGGKDLDIPKDVASVARIERTGTKIRVTVNRGVIETDNALFNDGSVGLLIPDSSIVIDKIRIVGEVEKGWLDQAIKAAEALGPSK